MSGLSGRVLVLGEDTRSFLSVVRSLGRSGLEVHAAWCALNAPAARSRYIHRLHRLPQYCSDDAAWLDALVETLQQCEFDLVVPCHDAAALLLQANRARLRDAPGIYLLNEDAFEVSFSKAKTYELARQLEIPLPPQRTVRSEAEFTAAAAELGFPLVLKPQASASLANPFLRHAVVKVWAPADVPATLGALDLAAGVLVQRNFRGRGVGVEVLARQGEVLAAFQHERVHEPLMGGGSSYRRSVPLDPDLLDAARRILRALRFSGPAMVEFKVDRAAGKWALMEINGRFWGSLPLAVAAGIDFPRFYYEMLCLGRTEFPRSYRVNLYCRNWLLDLYWLKANLRADRANPDLMTVPPRRVAAELANLLLWRERSDTFVLDDPAPALKEARGLLGSRLAPALRRLPFVRARMRRRALRALRRASSVLFLCRGNICRSPFAQHVVEAGSRKMHCESAGFFPVRGRCPPEAAIVAAESLGIDLGAHRSRVFTRELADRAEVIFIFDQQQRSELEGAYPECSRKVHYLGALDASGPLEVEDPYGGGIDACRASYERIQRLLAIP